jgi:hypothetical protein
MKRSAPRLGRVASLCLFVSLAVGGVAVAPSASAAPVSGSSSPKSAVAQAKPIKVKRIKRTRGISKWEASTPSRVERERAAAEVTMVEVPWATVSVRRPLSTTRADGGPYAIDAGDRAALAFADPKFVDARSGWAQWGASSSPGGNTPPSQQDAFSALACALAGIGCDDEGQQVDVDLHLWVKANAGHDYLAVCRVKFDDQAGELTITSEGAPTTSFTVDHTGSNADNVSFVIDPSGAGWYGVAIASNEAWSTTGCTIDEV